MKIVSKRHPYSYNFYISIINMLLLALLFFTIHISVESKKYQGLIIPLFIATFGIYINYFYIKNCPKLVLSTKGILIKNNFHEWSEVKDIIFSEKTNIINVRVECLTLVFKDNSVHKIIDEFYANSSEIKLFIEKFVLNQKKKLEIPISKVTNHRIENEFFNSYKGNPFFTFNGIAMWILNIMLLYYMATAEVLTLENIIGCISIIIVFTLLISNRFYYFEVTKNYLMIKNHHYLWIKKVYKISDIREIVFETQTNHSDKLRVITKDFKSTVFQADTLTNKTWLELKSEFESKNIKVRNECIPE